MNEFWRALLDFLAQEFGDLADTAQLSRALLRLSLAALLGGMLGWERQRLGKAAGLRTHMLVSLGAALIALIPQQMGMAVADQSRVIQGILIGIGFIGGGTILKLSEERQIQGLTTAANIWLTAAVGMAVGMAHFGLAFLSAFLAWVILSVLQRLEPHIDHRGERDAS